MSLRTTIRGRTYQRMRLRAKSETASSCATSSGASVTSAAARLSSSCIGFLGPIMADDTNGFASTHAKAMALGVVSCFTRESSHGLYHGEIGLGHHQVVVLG